MSFVRVRIVGVSRMHDDHAYEIRWTSKEPYMGGRVFAGSTEGVWSFIEKDVLDQYRKLPPLDPMMELVGEERGIDLHGRAVPV